MMSKDPAYSQDLVSGVGKQANSQLINLSQEQEASQGILNGHLEARGMLRTFRNSRS